MYIKKNVSVSLSQQIHRKMVINRIIPSLGLAKKSDAELAEYASQRIDNLTVNKLKFPGLTPDALALQDLLTTFNVAVKKMSTAPSRQATKDRDTARVALELALTNCSQNCAEIANGNDLLFLLSGFGIKSKGTRVSSLEIPQGLTFKQGPAEASVYANFKGVKNAASYEVVVGTSSNPATWTKVTVNRSSRMLITDLTPLTQYYGRCRAIGARNIKSDWSAVVEFKVM